MSETADRSRMLEASRWFTVMTRPSITPKELEAFRAWRRQPANAAAFDTIQKTWAATGGLGDRPEIIAATAAALDKYPTKGAIRAPSRRLLLTPAALGLAGLLVVAGGAVVVSQVVTPSYATSVGEQRAEVLADGSHVQLNTDTKLKVVFRGGERRVMLEHGQAYFDVAHDAGRPFVVEADGTQVRALGTKFDVRHDGAPVRVTLLQGRVEVRERGGRAAVLAPGQMVVASGGTVSAPAATNAPAVASWTTGRVDFSGAPLRDVITELNRYSRRKIVLDAPAGVGDTPISGGFLVGDIDGFVAGADRLYGLKILSETNREIRLGPGA